ncbi:unnamed protein product [Arctogadus glacialis]
MLSYCRVHCRKLHCLLVLNIHLKLSEKMAVYLPQLDAWYRHRSHNKVPTLLCFGTAMVERAPCRCQDCRVAHQLPQESQDYLFRVDLDYKAFLLTSLLPYSLKNTPGT